MKGIFKMLNFSFLLEQSADAPTGGNMIPMLIMLVAMVPLFAFMFIRQKKQQRKETELRDSIQVGDEVTTIGGIIGKVVSVKGDTFVLETTKDKTKIRFLKSSIRNIDVKAADIAASVMEVNAAPETADTADKKAEKKKAAKAKKEDAPEQKENA